MAPTNPECPGLSTNWWRLRRHLTGDAHTEYDPVDQQPELSDEVHRAAGAGNDATTGQFGRPDHQRHPGQGRDQRRADHPQQTVVGDVGDEPGCQQRHHHRRQRRQDRREIGERPRDLDDRTHHQAQEQMRQQALPGRVDHHAEPDRGERIAQSACHSTESGPPGTRGMDGGDGLAAGDGTGAGEPGDLLDPARHVEPAGGLGGALHLMDGRADLDEQHGGQHCGQHRLGGVAVPDLQQPLLDQLDGVGHLDHGDADLAQHRCHVGGGRSGRGARELRFR